MEFLFYFLCGILYSELVIGTIALMIAFMYSLFNFAFWIFDVFGIENPIMVAYEFIQNKLTS